MKSWMSVVKCLFFSPVLSLSIPSDTGPGYSLLVSYLFSVKGHTVCRTFSKGGYVFLVFSRNVYCFLAYWDLNKMTDILHTRIHFWKSKTSQLDGNLAEVLVGVQLTSQLWCIVVGYATTADKLIIWINDNPVHWRILYARKWLNVYLSSAQHEFRKIIRWLSQSLCRWGSWWSRLYQGRNETLNGRTSTNRG